MAEPRAGLKHNNILSKVFLLDIRDGLARTLRHLFKPPITLQYPYERWEPPERFRGFLGLSRKEAGAPNCIACRACERICPVQCIKVVPEGKGKDMHPKSFTIDYTRCMLCRFCVEVCPTKPKSIIHTHIYELTAESRERLTFQKEELLGRWDEFTGFRPQAVVGAEGPSEAERQES